MSSVSASSSATPHSVSDKYQIHENEILGKGAWSVVKKCTVVPPYTPPGYTPDMKLVVKIIEKEYLISLTKGDVDRAMSEVKREIEILKHIPPHANVVSFIEHVETEKQFLLVFEEIKSGDLCELILKTSGARIDEKRARKYTYQLIVGVLHCHVHDVIHRDIKPENLLVTEDDDLKLTDFGLAKWSRSASQGLTESMNGSRGSDFARLLSPFPGAEKLATKRCVCSDVIGTPRYGAPEMFYAKFTSTQYDGYKADTWSIGVVAYIMLSGTFPFFSGNSAQERDTFQAIMDTPLMIPNTVSSAAADFLHRLLHKDPLKRMTLAESLDHPWLEPEVVAPIPESIPRLHRLASDTRSLLTTAEEEILLLHGCLTKLRREVLQLKWKESGPLAPAGSYGSYGKPTGRSETPTNTSRTRPATSPHNNSAARLQSPGRIASGSQLHSTRTPTNGARTSSPARRDEISRGSTPKTAASATPSAASARAASPLVRSSPSTLRRGTPMRPSSSAATTPKGTATLTPAKRATTPVSSRLLTPSRGGSSASVLPSVAVKENFVVGDAVVYKGCRAVVQFHGPTTFGSGVWIGLEMLEGNEGTNDGASFVDKKRYFTCPKGKGVFVRASQIKKADEG